MATLPSGLPESIEDDEVLARFLTQRNQFTSLMAKPAAFLPNPRDRTTSVFRHGEHPRDMLWALGLEAAKDRKLYGAALVTAKAVRSTELEISADEPPARHAVIRGWPWLENDPELQKARQKQMALVIARDAGLCLREESKADY